MADDNKFKEEYEKVKQQYNLPSFEELDEEFDLVGVEGKPIRAVRKKLGEKIEGIAKFLEELIQPEASFSSMYEIKDLTEGDKEKILKLFKKFMILYREGSKLSLNLGNERDAKFILGFLNEWKEIKQELIVVLDKVQNSWVKDDIVKTHQEYFG